MSKERFDHLLSLVREKITKKDTRLREAITAEERLVITLRYLSAGMLQQDLCYSFRIGRTTVSNILKEVCDTIYDVLSPIYMQAPSTENEWRHIADDFEQQWDLPHCIGAIDGKHIGIDCPKQSGSNFYNYKSFFSIIPLAVCDARYNFSLIAIGQFGPNNDSGVLKNSDFGKAFKDGYYDYPAPEDIPGCRMKEVPFFLVGDEIFPLKRSYLRPSPGTKNVHTYAHPQVPKKRSYLRPSPGTKKTFIPTPIPRYQKNVHTYAHPQVSKTFIPAPIPRYQKRNLRGISKRFQLPFTSCQTCYTLRILAARWRIFRGFIRASLQNVDKYVLATLCLHNYLRPTDNAGYCPAGFVDCEDSTGRIKQGEWRSICSIWRCFSSPTKTA